MRAWWLVGVIVLGGCGVIIGPSAPRSIVNHDPNDELAEGRDEFRHGQFTEALAVFRRVQFELNPAQPEMAEVRYLLAECDFQTGDLTSASLEFHKVADEFPGSEYASLALMRAGDANVRLWHNPELDPTPGEAALATYQELLGRYPNTPAAARAQMRARELNDWFAVKDYQAGMFYFHRRAFDSAIIYFKDIIANYPGSASVGDALLRLVDSYKAIGYSDEQREACDNLRRFYPKATGLDRRCPASAPTP